MDVYAWPASNANSYVTLSNANAYHELSLHAANWNDTTTERREQALVTATRMIDRQNWKGQKTDPAQPLAWPRTGVTRNDGSTVDPNTLPPELILATYELALALLDNVAVQSQGDTGSNIKSLGAGSAQLSFFRPTTGTRFPTIIQELMGQFLSATGLPIGTAVVKGNDGVSVFQGNPSGVTKEYY